MFQNQSECLLFILHSDWHCRFSSIFFSAFVHGIHTLTLCIRARTRTRNNAIKVRLTARALYTFVCIHAPSCNMFSIRIAHLPHIPTTISKQILTHTHTRTLACVGHCIAFLFSVLLYLLLLENVRAYVPLFFLCSVAYSWPQCDSDSIVVCVCVCVLYTHLSVL